MMSKERWFRFFEQAEAELGVDAPQDDLAAMADGLLAEYEADRADQAHDGRYDRIVELPNGDLLADLGNGHFEVLDPPIPPKPVDWR